MGDTLEAHLDATSRALSSWLDNEKTSLEETKQRCTEEMEKDRQHLAHLEAQKAQLAASASHRDETMGEKLRLIQASQSEVRVLQAEMATSEPVVMGLRAQKAQHDSKLFNFSHDVTQASQAHATVVAELTKCIELYRKVGLAIDRKGDNNLGFIFTQIDRQVPTREFSFTLRINAENDVFVVDNCVPPVAEKDALLQQLNATGNLAHFVRSMRQQFQNTVLSS
ncbi:Aste57867_11038 [Aphanomyces stellatus]|uniref:Kinetochore protein SPC25 n=1 Tax=Aphanomyces stellatus TaxID=120398 RepID=A0A485KSL3_9STRA|nr:hypothetical protein As57867_010996 [Aphanomyces stellatus]VFT87906.1 Aste57867_11038 [Aphanomyces stellatus]